MQLKWVVWGSPGRAGATLGVPFTVVLVELPPVDARSFFKIPPDDTPRCIMVAKTELDFADADLEQLLQQVANGSEEAARKIVHDFTPHIISAVRASLPGKLRRRLDSEDAVQMVWASLLLGGDLSRLNTPARLIAYLAQVARYKVIDMSRRHMSTQKNDLNREESLDNWGASPNEHAPRLQLYASDPTPSQIATVRERWQRVVAGASPREREILTLLLDGNSNNQISEILSLNAGSVRRIVNGLIDKFSQ